jgi:hypothetical protein
MSFSDHLSYEPTAKLQMFRRRNRFLERDHQNRCAGSFGKVVFTDSRAAKVTSVNDTKRAVNLAVNRSNCRL